MRVYLSPPTGLRERLDHVRGLSEQNMAILREAVRMLDDEEHEDSQLRSRFVADWARTPSDRLTKELRCGLTLSGPARGATTCSHPHTHCGDRDEAQSMQGKLEAAKRADSLVRQKFEDSYNIIDSLCRTNELPNMLPAAVCGTGAYPVYIHIRSGSVFICTQCIYSHTDR